MFVKNSINSCFLGYFVMCGILGSILFPWNVTSQMFDEEKPIFSSDNMEEEPQLWLNSEIPTYGNVYDEPWTDDSESSPFEEENVNQENEPDADEDIVREDEKHRKSKSGKEKALKRAGQGSTLTTSKTPLRLDHGYVTVNDIANMTRNTKITIIASLCSIAVVFAILLAAICYLKFNNIFPRSAVERMKGAMSSFRGGSKAVDSHMDHADAERAEDESEDDENEDADFTVYECEGPALATSDMELRNPMFHSTKVEADQQ